MRLNSAGQLAVGVTNPQHSVDAAGNIRARGDFLVGLSTGTYLGDDNAIRPALSSAYLNLKGGAGRAKVSLANDFISLVAGNSGGNISFSTGATSSTDPGVEIGRFSAAGQLLIGTTSGASKLVVNDDSVQVTSPKTPASASETGQIAWDDEHIYVCTAPDTWKRSALTTW